MQRISSRTTLPFALVFASAITLGSAAIAQTGEDKEAADFAVSGTVTAVDAAKSSITIDGPNDDGGTYDVDPKATLKNGDKTIGLADVQKGWNVSANGDQRGDKKVVTYLEVDETP